MQSRWHSLLEAKVNTLSGFFASWAITYWVLPYIWGLHVTAGQSFRIVLLFTGISLCRNFVIRRIFNRLSKP